MHALVDSHSQKSLVNPLKNGSSPGVNPQGITFILQNKNYPGSPVGIFLE